MKKVKISKLPNDGTLRESDGVKCWQLNGIYHREDGPAVDYINGDKFWYLNGESHREDGPAVEYANGDERWYLNGQLHREDGPAISYYKIKDCKIKDYKIKEWWITGYHMACTTQEEFERLMKLKAFW
jgi:hypothetical protein